MHARGLLFQSGTNASLRSSKQQSFVNLPGLGMDDSGRSSCRTGSAHTTSGLLDPRRAMQTTWLLCFRRSGKEWGLFLLILGLLGYTEIGLHAVTGSRMYITDHMLETVKFPHVSSTVPSWAVPVYSLLGPPVLVCTHGALTDVNVGIRHTAVLGGLFSTAVSALATNLFKLTVGRPRPDFFFRCWPDGVVVWKAQLPNGQRVPECTTKYKYDVIDGYKSFPSGHTSWSFAAFAFLSLYLYYFIRPSGASDTLDLLVVLFPMMVGGWVGMTRVIDNYHNPSDVLAGGLLGTAIAILTFYTLFPHGRLPKPRVDAIEDPRLSEIEMLPV